MDKQLAKQYIEARRAVISAEFSHLNEMQRRAVMATEGPLLILAGAGSGKTTVLINRIANLLKFGRAGDCDELPPFAREEDIAVFQRGGEEAKALAVLDPAEPWRILAITFTNKAADELKERLERMLGEDANDIWACTFHSACVRILRRDADKLGFSDSFTIYDTADSMSLAKRIIKDMNLDDKTFAPRAVLSAISRAKDASISAGDFLKEARASGDIRRCKIGEIYLEYTRRLFSANAMDFDDLLYFTVKLLQENDEVREFWQKKFKYVLIDEYQDTNRLQYLFASIMAGRWGNICVVGDDDQSIYKFRGATIENILSFENEFRGCRTIRLEQNYRSTGHILDAANAVIRNNVGRKGKELWTNAGRGDKLELFVADNENEEARYVTSAIIASRGQGANWRDHAVLYRMNAQSSTLEFAFKRSGIPYRIIGGMRFFEHAEVKDMLAYLSVISSPSDDLRLSRIINVPGRGIGERSIQIAEDIAAGERISLFDVISHADSYKELARAGIKMRTFANLINELRAFSELNTPDLLYDELLEKTGYLRLLQESDDPRDATRAENVQELKSSILGFMKESGDNTLEGYLANVALYTDMDNYDREADAVVMMTMHSAKGLEFPTVFLVGMEETIFPNMRAIGEQEEMEEERRLCYVALTRAKKNLHLVSARQRMLFGRTTANRVSRFVDEIPSEHINKNVPKGWGYGDRSPEYTGRSSYGERPVSYTAPSPARNTPHYSVTAPAPKKAPAAEKESFSTGDVVVHTAFGRGRITKMQPMGGDYLIEIDFEKTGAKKLMLRAAALHMKKE